MQTILRSASLVTLALAGTSASADPAPTLTPSFEIAIDPVHALAEQVRRVREHGHRPARGPARRRRARHRSGPRHGRQHEARAAASSCSDHAFTGPYVEPGVVARNEPIAGICDASVTTCIAGRGTAVAIESFVGYQLTYASHYTIAAAIGISKPIATYDLGIGVYAEPRTETLRARRLRLVASIDAASAANAGARCAAGNSGWMPFAHSVHTPRSAIPGSCAMRRSM